MVSTSLKRLSHAVRSSAAMLCMMKVSVSWMLDRMVASSSWSSTEKSMPGKPGKN